MNLTLPFLSLFQLSHAALKSYSPLESYVDKCRESGIPVNMDRVLASDTPLDDYAFSYVLRHLQEDDSCSNIVTMYNAGYKMGLGALADFLVHATSMKTVFCLVGFYQLKDQVPLVNIAFPNLLKRFKTDPEVYKPIFRSLVEMGLPLSEVEMFILSKIGVEVQALNIRELELKVFPPILTALNGDSLSFDLEFIELVISTVLSTGNDMELIYKFGPIYAAVDDDHCVWFNSLKGIGLDVTEDFLGHAIQSGYDNNLQCVLPSFSGPFRSVTQLLSSMSYSKVENNSQAFQDLFRRLLIEYKPMPYDFVDDYIFRIVISRPDFVDILQELRPEMIVDAAESLPKTMGLSLWNHFVTAIQNSFDGPDRFLKHGAIEIGNWFLGKIAMSNKRSVINAGMRYIIHRNMTNALINGDESPLHVAVYHSISAQEDEPFECIQELINAGADVNAAAPRGTHPMDLALYFTYSPSLIKTLVMLIKAGADFSHVAQENHKYIRRALWETSIKYIIEGIRDPNSLINEYVQGSDVVGTFNEAIIGHDGQI